MRTTVGFVSCVLSVTLQKELLPSAAEIECSHAVDQQWIVVAACGPNERSPSVAQPFNRSDATFFHIHSNTWSQRDGLSAFGITAPCENASKRGVESPRKASATPYPITEPT